MFEKTHITISISPDKLLSAINKVWKKQGRIIKLIDIFDITTHDILNLISTELDINEEDITLEI